MNQAFRTIAISLAAVSSAAACSNSSKPVADVLAEDSTLAREVMSANRDSLSGQGDTGLIGPAVATTGSAPAASAPAASAPIASTPRKVSVLEPAVSATRAKAAERSPHRVATTTSTRASAPRRSVQVARSSSTGSRSAATRVSHRRTSSSSAASSAGAISTAPARSEPPVAREATRMRSSAMIPAGLELILAADQRVCESTSKVGDQFGVRFAEDVVGPIGVVIPKGTAATAQVSSVSDLDMDITSLTVGGRTYPIGSDRTNAQVETIRTKSTKGAAPVVAGAGLGGALGGVIGRDVKSAVIGAAGGALAGALATRATYRTDRCVPEGGKITTTLSEPLRIALTE